MSRDPDWEADLKHYGSPRVFLKEQSIWAVWLYRYGRRLDRRSPGVLKRIGTIFYLAAFRLVETVCGVSLPKSAIIGPGIRIWHFGNVFVHPDAVLGSGCVLRQGVTIGNRYADGPVPIIGDNLDCGAYAQILGNVHIGDNCKIGAMSVVLSDVPDGATAVGSPARIILLKPVIPQTVQTDINQQDRMTN